MLSQKLANSYCVLSVVVARRSARSPHSTHTASGIDAGTDQPAKDRAAEAVAENTLERRGDDERYEYPPGVTPARVNQTMVADPVKARPIVWANRFGGPGTDFCHEVSRGAATRVANWPRGEIFGPAATRATNPYVRGMRSQAQLVASATTAIVKTPRATVRAAASLTGLGKEKKLFIR